MKTAIYILLIVLIASCKSSYTPSSIALTPIANYTVRTDVSITDDTSYFYFENDSAFLQHFNATKSSPGMAGKPDFATQRVVAVVIRPTTELIDLSFVKAEIVGKDVNLYYTLSPLPGTSFLRSPFCLATIPISMDAKQVNFYKNGLKTKTLQISAE